MQPKKFGVIGHPIGHSLSAIMHNKVFKELNLPHTYKAFDIAPENLKQFINETDLDGINVTIPHKIEAMKYLNTISDKAKKIQAINTISFNQIKKGDNTDWIGFQNSLKEEDVELEDKKVLVIGAGGVSRAILVALTSNKAKITLTNRTKQKAIDLTQELNIIPKIIDYNPESLKETIQTTDIIVNTTSIGMHPNENKSPIPKELLRPNHIIFDVVYNPLKTKLIQDAEEIGCKTISGVNMLVHQGAQSLRIWLGIDPPIQTMKDAVLESLK